MSKEAPVLQPDKVILPADVAFPELWGFGKEVTLAKLLTLVREQPGNFWPDLFNRMKHSPIVVCCTPYEPTARIRDIKIVADILAEQSQLVRLGILPNTWRRIVNRDPNEVVCADQSYNVLALGIAAINGDPLLKALNDHESNVYEEDWANFWNDRLRDLADRLGNYYRRGWIDHSWPILPAIAEQDKGYQVVDGKDIAIS